MNKIRPENCLAKGIIFILKSEHCRYQTKIIEQQKQILNIIVHQKVIIYTFELNVSAEKK